MAPRSVFPERCVLVIQLQQIVHSKEHSEVKLMKDPDSEYEETSTRRLRPPRWGR